MGYNNRMSIDNQRKINLSDIFPPKDWAAQEHLLLTGEPIEVTRAKRLGLAILETVTGPFIAAPVAFVAAGLLGLFNHSEAQAMGNHPLPDHHSPRFEDMDNFAHHLQLSETQQAKVESCPLHIFWIQGASPSTEGPVYYPATMPCNINYTGDIPTLTFTGLDFESYGIKPNQSAVLITPIAALTENGKIPLLINTYIREKATDGASILCPSDVMSNLMLGNSAGGNGFTSSPEATRECYEASEAVVNATAFDSQGQAHPLNMTVDGGGNMFIFADTTLTESGILKIQVGYDIHWPTFIQSSLMNGLRERFGEDVVVLFAPNGVDPVAERFPILVEKTPEPPALTATEVVAPNNVSAPQNTEEVEIAPKEEVLPRQVFGQNLSVQLTCLNGECPEVYGIVDENLEAFQNLMQLYGSGSITDDDQAGKLVGEIIANSDEPKIVNWIRGLFGKEAISPPVKKFSDDGINLNLSDVIYISQDQSSTVMLATLNLDGKTLYFLIKGKSKLLSEFSFQLTDQAGNPDQAGLQVFRNIEEDVTKADSPSYLSDWGQDLFVTRRELVSGLESGGNILHIAEAYQNETVGGYQITEDGLIPATINLATVGKYAGKLYKDPKDGKLYIGVATVDKAGRQTGTFLVPMEYIDTSK